jgi:CDP-glucose 4,6-dehydratase
MAAQPLVRASYFDPLETFSTNYMGTANILESFRGLHDLRVAVMVTTDKVYRENRLKKNYLETDELGGWDPYSASKASSEILIDSYKKSFFNDVNLRIAVARAGNVIGGGDWSKDRLFPDLIRAQESREVLVIRHPESTRPWQHVLECLQAYTKLAEKLHNSKDFQGEYNFGPDTNSQLISVKDIAMMARNYYQDLKINYESDQNVLHEANNLGLNTIKAKEILGVASIWSVEESIKKTLDWYKSFGRGVDARTCCLSDIQKLEQDYEAL